ncbi:VC0807 family protein [Pseudonocardia oroxyli]|uniref:Intracellular septation protein A n=1 Tax=Pseudonocardia oroxyli TaxID=366584 RepID=A0A1G7I9Z1_PSEOR|nr:VC0807 family protein [Pseudonocardia oroxyli]SDF09567.1 Intracellular septation protein A [Pseudonocardia oroxyli]
MPDHRTLIHLPSLGSLVRHAGRPLLESTLIPLALFWILFTHAGFDAGVIGALCWSGLAIGRRLVLRRKVPAVLWLTTTLLVVRTAVGLWTHSAFLYFLQPTVQNFVFAGLLVLTLGLKQPLLARLADDFCAFPDALTEHPTMKSFFRKVSLLWAAVFLVNGVTTLAVLATQTVGSFLMVSTAGSYSLVAVGIGVSLWWLHRSMKGEGFTFRMGAPRPLRVG